jgi:two-component system sensor histidine kinase/response regulator
MPPVAPSMDPLSSPHCANIMIVDDNPANLKLLEDMLQQRGHEVCSFPRGRLAIAGAVRHRPDLILLDINMPEMNGYEVCERLKAMEQIADIPVIFLSALIETQGKVKAFQCGAVDYISKPFQFEEVHARVETHLKLHRFGRELTLQNERLEEAVGERTRELAEANVQLTILDRSKNELLDRISHELRTPLNGLLGVAGLALDEMPSTELNNELRGVFERSRGRLLSLIDNALLLTEINIGGAQFTSAQVSLHGALSCAIGKTSEFAASHHVGLAQAPACADFIRGNDELLIRALHALIETAVRFSEEGETVRLAHETASDSSTVVIESYGKTIPDPVIPIFFDLFSVDESSTPGRDLGLGPAVAYRILALFGASVGVANRKPSGIRLTISFRSVVPAVSPALV